MKITKRQLRITESALRRCIRAVLLKEEMISIVRNDYEDLKDINILANYAMKGDMQGALNDESLKRYIDKNEAPYLVDDSHPWVGRVGDEGWNMPAPEGWDLKKVQKFFKDFEDEAYKVYSKKAAAASAAAPNRTERKAIGNAFTYDDVPEDAIAYITFQLRKKGGKVVNINMEDRDSRLGNMTTGMSEEEAKSLGTTLDKVERTLRDGGAKERKKSKLYKKSPPQMYD